MILTLTPKELFVLIRDNWENFLIPMIIDLKILSEFDFQIAFNHFLFMKLNEVSDDSWRIYNIYYFRRKRAFPDSILYQNNNPRIVIEFKNYLFNSQSDKFIQKDVEKLNKIFISYPGIMKYGISMNLLKRPLNIKLEKGIYDDKIHVFNLIKDNIPKLKNIWGKILDNYNKINLNLEKARKSLFEI